MSKSRIIMEIAKQRGWPIVSLGLHRKVTVNKLSLRYLDRARSLAALAYEDKHVRGWDWAYDNLMRAAMCDLDEADDLFMKGK